LKSTIEPMLKTSPGKIESIFSDSLEVYRQNWTHDFPEQFKKLRGYDLIPRLLDLFDDKSADAAGLRQDFWQTVAELSEQRYVKRLYDWAHENGLQTELQPYGTPPLPMTSSAFIDMPTGEHYEWRGFNVCRYVASAAHQEGKNIVGSEAWTWGAIPNRLTDSLSDLKLMSDMHFLSGVNDITGVDYPYSPASAGIPGWLPYYGPSLNENNPQWAVFPDLVKYLNRCSWMLRQGKPAAKVAVYLPIEDGMAKGGTEQLLLDFAVRDHFVTGPLTSEFGLEKAMHHRSDLVETLMKEAIGFDGLDFWSLNKLGKIHNSEGHSELEVGTASYRVVVIPRIESIDLSALRLIEQFCQKGGIVAATGVLPHRANGMSGPAADSEVQAIVKRLFPAASGTEYKRVGEGVSYFLPTDADLYVLRDMEVSQARISTGTGLLGVVRRDIPDGEIYFVSNPTDAAVDYSLQPLPKRKNLEMWNPLTGEIHTVAGQLVNSRLPARGSMFIVARGESAKAAIAPTGFGFESQANTQTLDGDWQLSFLGPDAPGTHVVAKPTYWETLPGCDKFSGSGIYIKKFQLANWPRTRAILSLPEVHDAAEIVLNGKKAGFVWLPPYQLDVSKFLRDGVNKLEIHVYSSMANRFIALPDMDMAGLRKKYGGRFSAPEEKQLMKGPEHAGIDGQVKVIMFSARGSFHP